MVALDSLMLGLFAVLMSWRFTGLSLHEWLGVGLLALILFHLLVHWGWVEARVALARKERRRFGALLLNGGLFVAMGTTLVSGVIESKVLWPNHLTPAAYLRWHGLHENAATITVLMLGLHLAFNWNRIVNAIRNAFARSAPRLAGRGLAPMPVVLRRVAWIVALSGVLTGAVWLTGRALPGTGEVIMVYPDGHQERRPPPAEITRAWPEANRPAPGQGAPRLLVSLALLAVTVAAGRKLLRLRLRRRAGVAAPASPVPNE